MILSKVTYKKRKIYLLIYFLFIMHLADAFI